MDNETVVAKKYMSFKERYQNEEYKKKHLEKIKELVRCEMCNCEIMRCGRSRHERSQKHILNKMLNDYKENSKQDLNK
jgi:hypothetical protein